MEQLQGVIKSIKGPYKNNWCILNVDGNTVTGCLFDYIQIDDLCLFEGRWKVHKVYGKEFIAKKLKVLKKAEPSVDKLLIETQNLKKQLKNYKTELESCLSELEVYRNFCNSFLLEFKNNLRSLIFLCHPDKHNNSKKATEIMIWLNEIKKTLKITKSKQ